MPTYKLQDLPSLANLPEKSEVSIEGIPDGKVLLVKSGEKIHALSPRCTHYGAPLVGGVVDGERLTCPWHGACFNITTGDVEDAPALNALHKFELVEKEDGVYILAEEADIKSGQRNPVSKCTLPENVTERVVVVGGGSGTISLVQTLRAKSYTGKITILTKEPIPIDRPKLSKALIPDSSKIALRPQTWFEDSAIEILNEEVTSINFSSKSLLTSEGNNHKYDKLVLATGGIPRRLPLPGFNELENIYTLRNVADVQSILNGIESVSSEKNSGKSESESTNSLNIVVIGSSFIGMEIGNALQSKGHTVTIVGMESQPMERVMGKEVGQIFRRNLEKSGISFKLDASVEKASASTESAKSSTTTTTSSSSSVGAVHLKDGSILPADIVILGVGVRPATDFLKENKAISLEKDGSIRTDEHFAVSPESLQSSSSSASASASASTDSDVFAIGDIATFPYNGPGGNGSHTRIEHWNVAQNAGRSVANAILHTSTTGTGTTSTTGKNQSLSTLKATPLIPIFWSALGAQLRYVGNTVNGFDDVYISGQPEEGKFVAYYFLGEVVVAVATMGSDPVMAKVAALMRRGRMIGKGDVRGGVDVLSL